MEHRAAKLLAMQAAILALAGCSRGVSFSPDGKRLVAASDSGLRIMNADGTGARKVPDGSRVAVAAIYGTKPDWMPLGKGRKNGRFRVVCVVMRLDGSQPCLVRKGRIGTRKDAELFFLVWSPDGSRLALQDILGSRLYVYDANGSHGRMIFHEPKQ